MMKFALFLVCALVAVQGFEARSAQPDERALSDIVDAIKAAIEKVKQIISDVTSQIPELINNIKDKIQDIVGKIPDIISGIKNKIEELIQMAGEVGRKCVEGQRDNIEALITFAQDGFQDCVTQAQAETEALKAQVDKVVAKVSAVRDDIIARTLKCVDDHKLNPVALFNCLKEQVAPITEEIAAIQPEVAETIKVAKETAEKVGASLTKCTAEVQDEVGKKEAAILEEIKQCITASK